MSSDGKVIAKNVSVLMFSQIITWGLTLLLMVFLPRYLGAENMGKLHLASSLWIIVGMFVTFGMDTYLAKEIARDKDKTSELLGTSIVVRTILYLIGFGGLALFAYLVDYPQDTIAIILIIGVSNYFYQIGHACYATLQGLERMEYISLADIVSKVFNTFVSILLLYLGAGVFHIALVSIGTGVLLMGVQLYYVNKLHRVKIKFDRTLSANMLRSSYSYFLTSISQTIYVTVDIVIISLVLQQAVAQREQVIGWYSVVDQLFGTLLFVVTIFVKAIFPVLSRMYTNDRDALPKMMQSSFNLLLMLGVPIGFGLIVVSTNLVTLLFGEEFINSGSILAIYGIVLIFTYQNTLLGQFLISTDRQSAVTRVMIAASVMVVVVEIFLIPLTQNELGNGGIGVALAFIITECFICVASVRLLPKGSLDRSTAYTTIKIIVAGLVMIAVTWWFRDMFIAIPVLIGAAVYGIMVLVLRVVPKNEMDIAKGMLTDAIKKLRQRRQGQAANIVGDN